MSRPPSSLLLPPNRSSPSPFPFPCPCLPRKGDALRCQLLNLMTHPELYSSPALPLQHRKRHMVQFFIPITAPPKLPMWPYLHSHPLPPQAFPDSCPNVQPPLNTPPPPPALFPFQQFQTAHLLAPRPCSLPHMQMEFIPNLYTPPITPPV